MLAGIKEWVAALLITSVIGGLYNFILPPGGKSFQKYIRLTTALIAVLVMLAPIKSLFGGLPGLFAETGNYAVSGIFSGAEKTREWTLQRAEEVISAAIKEEVKRSTGVEVASAVISCDPELLEAGEYKIISVKITVPEGELERYGGKSAFAAEISRFTEENFGCPVVLGE